MNEFLFPSQLKAKMTIGEGDRVIPIERRRQLHKAIFDCVVRDGRPFDDFNKPGMRSFLAIAIPNYTPPHRTTVRHDLETQYVEHRDALRAIIPTAGWLALTTDIWKNTRREYYICITGHFLTDDFETVPLVVGFRRLAGRHLAPRIRSYIEHELSSLGVNKSWLSAITTDNGSDVKSATAHGFGQRISCLAHNINLTIGNGLCLWRKPNPSK
jgi:hypothetical protein